MKIITANTAGFCMGVRRAVDMVLDAANTESGPIYTYGPLIHNPQVLEMLQNKGVTVLNDIPESGSGTVLIRAHGVPPEAKQKLKDAGFHVVDATCPRVIRVQSIIRKHAEKGEYVIIIGDRDHPEVVGLLGYAGARGVVVDSLDALKDLPACDRAIIVAQTTQNMQLYAKVEKWANETHPHYKLYDTICDSTEKRQDEIRAIADSVDAVVVVGGKNSGNTQRLAEVAAEAGKPSFHVETESELDYAALGHAGKIGLTAGASTPNWIIKRVYNALDMELSLRSSGWQKNLFWLQAQLLRLNLYLSLGAGALCLVAMALMGISGSPRDVGIAILYVLSMQLINNITGVKSDLYNEPGRAGFYQKYTIPLTGLAILCGMAGLYMALQTGFGSFVLLGIMSILGLGYNLRVLPKPFAPKYRKLKDIPGSKTILIALAWGMVTTILPAIHNGGVAFSRLSTVFLWATGMVFVRNALFDALDIQGDRIVGKETLPILLGERRTAALLKYLTAGLAAVLPVASLTGLTSAAGLMLWFYPVCMLRIVMAQQSGKPGSGVRFEFYLESMVVLAGCAALLWLWLAG